MTVHAGSGQKLWDNDDSPPGQPELEEASERAEWLRVTASGEEATALLPGQGSPHGASSAGTALGEGLGAPDTGPGQRQSRALVLIFKVAPLF